MVVSDDDPGRLLHHGRTKDLSRAHGGFSHVYQTTVICAPIASDLASDHL